MALPVKLNMALITALQKEIAPEIFTPRAVYDGRKNLFSVVPLQLTGPGGNSQEVCTSSLFSHRFTHL